MNSIAHPRDGIVTTSVAVQPGWLDYNNHMNVAYYVVAFDLGIDAFKEHIGIDLAYIERQRRSTVALESHITFQREAHIDEQLRIDTRVVDFDGKRVHYYQEMFRDDELLATQETLSISFDTAARRSCLFEERIAENYQAMVGLQAHLPRPAWVGRAISIRRKAAG